MADNDIKIYGALRAMTGDGIAAYAEQIYDEESGKYLPELLEEAATGTAESTSYDNTESGLPATNVQDAIDKLEDFVFLEEEIVENISQIGNSSQININGEIVDGASYRWNVLYFKLKEGEKVRFLLSYSISKDVRFGFFLNTPVVGSSCISGTYKQMQSADIEYAFIAPSDGFFAYSYYVSGTGGTTSYVSRTLKTALQQNTAFENLINKNIERCKSATLNIIGDSISNPDRSGYSLNTIWWKIMADALEINVGTYSCISGTPVGGTASNSFHNRVSSLTLDGTITIIAGGMNDLGTDNVPLGDFNYSSSLSSQITEDPTLTNNFIPAYRQTIEYILNSNKNTRLYLCTITPRAIKKNNMSDEEYYFPWTNKVTGNNWLEYNNAIRKLAHDYGIGIIDFSNIGMYFQNGYANEDKTVVEGIWTPDGVHPNIAYQRKMGEYATKIIAESMF